MCKKKEAPVDLKKQVKMLIKLEKNFIKEKKEERNFLNSIPTTLTVRQINQKCTRFKQKKYKIREKILMMKRYIGLSNQKISIIIPVKQTI